MIRRRLSALAPLAVVPAGLLLAACGNSSGSGSGLSTASVLGEAPAAASGESPGITREDPMARPVQVAWTSARAQKCGYNFDPAKLRANFLAHEQRQGAAAAQLANYERAYDATVAKIRQTIESPETYCTDKKSAEIKADLHRHLAGNYDPSFPQDRKIAAKGFWESLASNEPEAKMDSRRIWQQLEDRKNGVRTAE